MILCARRGPEIKHPHVRVRSDGADQTWVVRRKLRTVRAAVGRQREDALRHVWVPHFDRAVPGAREEGFLGGEIPLHREDLAGMFGPCRYGEFVQGYVEEFYAAVPACHHDLVLVSFAPGCVEESIFGVEPRKFSLMYLIYHSNT